MTGIWQRIGLLHEDTAIDVAKCPGLPALRQIADLHEPDIRLPFGFGREYFHGGSVEVRRDDGIHQQPCRTGLAPLDQFLPHLVRLFGHLGRVIAL